MYVATRKRGKLIILLCITLLLALIGALAALENRKRAEAFATAGGIDAITTNVLQHTLWLSKRGIRTRAVAFQQDTWETSVGPALVQPEVYGSLTAGADVVLVSDPLDADTMYKGLPRIGYGPKGYFVALTKPGTALLLDCSYSLSGKKIGYLDRPDYLFIQAIIHGYRLDASQISLTQVPLKDWDNLPNALDDGLDVIITYVVPESGFHKLIQVQTMSAMGFRGLDADRIKLFYPHITIEKDAPLRDTLASSGSTGLLVMDREKTTSLPAMRTALLGLAGSPPSIREGFVTRLSISAEADDPSYRCYGDITNPSKAACESPFDDLGQPKTRPTYWDRPCIRNEDCPFFKANENYPNQRGGCLQGGLCEFPIGMRRKAFRLYEDVGIHAPFCYSCDTPTDPECCNRQKGLFGTPDYAFPNDTEARKTARMETTLAMK